MEKIEHKMIPVNGLNIHVAEIGEGPVVLFLHGFPELWYSWRHQMVFMAAHGYRAVAPDMRGYGDTTGAPVDDPSKFSVLHLVGDLIALLDAVAPDADKVFVVGHDWGAIVAWHLCLYRPDRVKALVNLSLCYAPRDPEMNIVEMGRKMYGDDIYICRFQEPGDIEAEFANIGAKEVIKNFLSLRDPGPLYFPKGKGFGYSADRAPWLTEEDLDYYATKFEHTGFTGALNYYRAFSINWELNAPWTGAEVKVPTKFMVGELDLAYHFPGVKDYIHKGGFKKFVPLLDEVVVLDGAAHFFNQERADKSLITILQQILNSDKKRWILDHNKPQMESLLEKASSLKQILENSSPATEILEREIRDAAHEAEDIIELHMLDEMLMRRGDETITISVPDLQQVIQQLDSAAEKAMKIMDDGNKVANFSSPSVSFSPDSMSFKNIVVGLDDDLIMLKDRLTRPQSKLEIIPIVGLGGIEPSSSNASAKQASKLESTSSKSIWHQGLPHCFRKIRN